GIVLFSNGNNNVFIANSVYSNTSAGVYTSGSTGNVFANNNIGYSSASVSSADTGAEIAFDNATASTLVIKNSLINPSPGIGTSGFAQSNSYLLNYSSGVLQVYGDYQLSGSTLAVDFANSLYISTATAPVDLSGHGNSATVTIAVDSNVVTQLIT